MPTFLGKLLRHHQFWITGKQFSKARNSRKKPGRKATWDNDIRGDLVSVITENADYTDNIFLLTGLRIYTPTEGRALRGPRALDSPV